MAKVRVSGDGILKTGEANVAKMLLACVKTGAPNMGELTVRDTGCYDLTDDERKWNFEQDIEMFRKGLGPEWKIVNSQFGKPLFVMFRAEGRAVTNLDLDMFHDPQFHHPKCWIQ